MKKTKHYTKEWESVTIARTSLKYDVDSLKKTSGSTQETKIQHHVRLCSRICGVTL